MNNKGFTLIEVLAMVVVLGILIAVAVPNITGIVENQKMNVLKNDASTMVETAKIKSTRLTQAEKPGENECIIYTLNYLNDEGNIVAGPHGKYYVYDSFVVYTKKKRGDNYQYEYWVRLVEEYKVNSTTTKKVGMACRESSTVVDFNKKNLKNLGLYEVGENEEESILKLSPSYSATSTQLCSAGIKKYYPGVKVVTGGV